MSKHVIGKERSQGVYEGYAYDNTILYVTEPNGRVEGLKAEAIKVKGTILPFDKVQIGDEVKVYYDNWRKPAFVEVIRKEV